MTAHQVSPNPRVAFIVSKFPCYDEAFILREIYALSKTMEIAVFSLKKSKEKVLHDEARELLPQTVYVPYLFSLGILKAHFNILSLHPFRYARALLRLIRGNLQSFEFLLKGLMLFPKAVYLADWLDEKKMTHIHAYWATYPTSVAMVASEITGLPFSFTGHAHDIYLNRTQLREKMTRASFISTCTERNKAHLQTVAPKVSQEKIFVHYHGLDLDRFYVNGKKRNETFQILSVGTLHYHKGFNYFLDALKRLEERGLQFQATLIGGGPLEFDLRKHIRALGLESKVKMTGPLKQSDVIPFYKNSDLLILMAQPEWHWGIPNVLIEALAAKTAVITTRFGSVEELIREGETGLFVPPKDSLELADTIKKLYAGDDLRRRLAEAGHRLVIERFDLKKNIQTLSERRWVHEDGVPVGA